jgi:hypothetical protein
MDGSSEFSLGWMFLVGLIQCNSNGDIGVEGLTGWMALVHVWFRV